MSEKISLDSSDRENNRLTFEHFLSYDRNGNLTYDMEMDTNFASNSLNLSEKAVRNDTIVAKYSYLVDGTKLAVINGDDSGFSYRGSFT